MVQRKKKVVSDDSKSAQKNKSIEKKVNGWVFPIVLLLGVMGFCLLAIARVLMVQFGGIDEKARVRQTEPALLPKSDPFKKEEETQKKEPSPSTKGDDWTAFYDRDVLWFHISADGSSITDTTLDEADGDLKATYTGITKNALIVRNGLAFFFSDFEKNCKAHQESDGGWVVDQENDYIKMAKKDMKKFLNSIKVIDGLKGFIPDVLAPKGASLRADGRANNRSGKYRIAPIPGNCPSEGGVDELDAIC